MKTSKKKNPYIDKITQVKNSPEKKLFIAYAKLADLIRGSNDPDRMIAGVLDKLSVMMNTAISCWCSVEDEKLIVKQLYTRKPSRTFIEQINIDRKISSAIQRGDNYHTGSIESIDHVLGSVSDSLPGLHNLLIIPFKNYSKGLYCFLFAVDDKDYSLSDMETLMQEIIKVMLERLEYLYLLDELRKINLELDKKVSDRISELWETNSHLRAEMEEVRKSEDELKLKNEELNQFVYRVAHDLRAPIISVEGLINLIKLDLESKQGNLKPFIMLLEDRMKHLDRFISDILSYSRNIRTAITVERIDFQKIIDSCFEELHYLENAKMIRKSITIDGDEFYSDRVRVYEIFRNLISNTIKYADQSKARCRVLISIQTNEKMTEILIRDNGIGIPAEILPKIYDMFFRGHESSKGSGIGLYLVRQNIEKMRGKIKVKSVPEKGTEFKIYLPNEIPSD